MVPSTSQAGDLVRKIALPMAPCVALAMYVLLGSAGFDTGLGHVPRAVAACGIWMALWWMTEPVPLPATSLLPLVLFPALGISPMSAAAAPYAHPLVVLFFGGFVLGMAVEKWGLHRRIALTTVLMVGTKPTRLIAGFMLATAVLSMFISNTATAIMLLPIAVSVIKLLDGLSTGDSTVGKNFPPALVLGIAYASSIGGVTTITGTQPNLLTIGFLRDVGVEISWAGWLPLGLTLLVIMLPLTWLILTRIAFPIRVKGVPGASAVLRQELRGLGGISRGEWTVLVVFGFVALGWICRGWVESWLESSGHVGAARGVANLGDAGVALIGAIALFAIPVRFRSREFAMDWASAVRMPWDVLLLFGGGLSLAAAMKSSGLDVYLGGQLAGLSGLPTWLLIGLICLTIIMLTELTSNTATTAAFVPILGGAAGGLGVHPALLMIPAGIVASYAFMLPVATPPNAIVFSSGRVTIPQMARAGLLLNLTGVVVVTIVVSQLAGPLLGLDLSAPPATEAAGVTP